MSEDEKNAQIGSAVSDYQAAKVEVAHIEQKIERVFATYRELGRTMDSSRGSIHEPKLLDGKIQFGYLGTNVSSADILNENDLTALVVERDKARKRLREAQQLMNSLGIIGLS